MYITIIKKCIFITTVVVVVVVPSVSAIIDHYQIVFHNLYCECILLIIVNHKS